MIERVKSIVLTVLMLSSLLLSGLLWYKSPNLEEINRNDYIPQQLIGDPRQLEQLANPRSIIHHPGNGRHFMAFAGDNVYDTITKLLPEWQFVQTEKRTLSPDEWERLLQETPGWELRFSTSVPASVFSERLLPGMDELDEQGWIDRIWIYRQQNEFKALFISDLENSVYESQIVANDGDQALEDSTEPGLLAVTPVTETTVSANPYEPVKKRITYFPERPGSMPEWKAALREIDVEEMKNLLFLDPSLVRTVTDEEEGTVIMQDGSRSVRYVKASNMLYYQNFKMKLDGKPIDSDLNEAVQFINRHGGWMADHRLVGIEGGESEESANRYEFRLIKNGLPVYDEGNKNRFGTFTAVESKGGHVLRYDRSLHFTAEDEYMKSSPVAGGSAALEQLMSKIDMEEVRDMFPAYSIVQKKEEIRFVPGWRIQFTNGDETWFDDLVNRGGKANGLE